jgi:hypothetical protein
MAKPKMAMIPSTVGGSVYSVLPSNGDGDFNFTRASAATRINAQGLIETVAVGDNRLNYPLLDGTVQTCPHLLLEPQRTNLFTYSEDFSNAYWTKTGSSVVSGFTSPDGTANAFKLVEDTSTGVHKMTKNSITVSGTNNTHYFFAKAAGRNWIRVSNDNMGSSSAYFDLDNGVIGTSGASVGSKIEGFGNGWYKCSVSYTVTTTNSYPVIYLAEANNYVTYTGDGTSGVYIYGAQLEEGSYPTSYIVSNSGSATTRLAEVCNGSGNASTFNDSEGVLMAQIGALADDLTFKTISISDGTTPNSIRIYPNNVSNAMTFLFFLGGVAQASYTHIFSNIKELHKVAFKYKVNDFKVFIDGIEEYSSTSGSVFSPNTLQSLQFNSGSGSERYYGKTKQIQYFDSALTDSELETLTSWMSFSDMAIDLNYTIQ